MSGRHTFNPYRYMLDENRVIWIITGVTIAQVIISNATGWLWIQMAAVLFLAIATLYNKGRIIRWLASPFTPVLPLEEIEHRLSGIVPAAILGAGILEASTEDPDGRIHIKICLREKGPGGNIRCCVSASGSGWLTTTQAHLEDMADTLLLENLRGSRALREAIIQNWSIEVERSTRLSNHEHLAGLSFMSRARAAMT